MADVDIHSLKSLIVFKTLFETGTASQAARTLGITQSGVSRSLAQFERALGIQLFLREKNRLISTPEARELYDLKRAQLREIQKQQTQLQRGPTGEKKKPGGGENKKEK
ncbi:MAG: LysR family transcriptional regulator [Acidihalobacter sp.]